MNAARGKRWTIVATGLGFAVVQLDVSIVNVAIKPIGDDLGGAVSGLQWVVGTYTLAFAALILTAGALGDRIGARRTFVAGFAVFTVASTFCGLAPSLGVLVAARAVQGAGAAALVACSLTLLRHAFTGDHERTTAIGLWAAAGSAALALGPLAGGVLVTTLGWRAIFFVNIPIGLAGILMTLTGVAETVSERSRRVDLPGQLAAVVALGALAAATIEAGKAGFGSPAVLAGYAVAAIAAAAFITVERWNPEPMLPLRLFRSETFRSATAVGLLINVAFYGLIFVFSLFFQRTQGRTTLTTGLAFLPMTLAVIGVNVFAGRITRRFGVRRTIVCSSVLSAAGFAYLLALGPDATTSLAALVAGLVVVGVGIGSTVPAMTSALLGSVERSRAGVGAGTLNASRQTGSVLGVALFGSLVAAEGLVSGLHIALGISIGLLLATALLARGIAAPERVSGRTRRTATVPGPRPGSG